MLRMRPPWALFEKRRASCAAFALKVLETKEADMWQKFSRLIAARGLSSRMSTIDSIIRPRPFSSCISEITEELKRDPSKEDRRSMSRFFRPSIASSIAWYTTSCINCFARKSRMQASASSESRVMMNSPSNRDILLFSSPTGLRPPLQPQTNARRENPCGVMIRPLALAKAAAASSLSCGPGREVMTIGASISSATALAINFPTTWCAFGVSRLRSSSCFKTRSNPE
mmetsp:Transcript_10424/g.26759  ORF Transcript_10424/g.26759 Transcript_10424/m.26759 type:complete len:228 (+) Transcript_10424:1189-1872(+)